MQEDIRLYENMQEDILLHKNMQDCIKSYTIILFVVGCESLADY